MAEARKLQRKLFDGGFAGISYPAEYGGRGLTTLHERAFREEALNYVTPDFGAAGGVTFGAIGRSLLAHCTPDFLEQHIPKILRGEELWCQFYSEPEAGSDLAGIRTRAVRDGDRWIISGSKIWSSGAYLADWAMCLARADWEAPKHRGLTWFALPTDAKGVEIRQIRQINGNAEFCEEFLDEVEVTDADIIGEVNKGWAVTQTMLVYERGAGEMGATTLEPPARPRPGGAGLQGGSRRGPGRPPGHRQGPHQRLRAVPPGPTHRRAVAPLGHARPGGGGLRQARLRVFAPIGPDWPEVADRPPWRGPRVTRTPAARRSTTSTGGPPRSPRAPTRCSATASASVCSACPANRASTPTSRSTRCWPTPATGRARSAERRQRDGPTAATLRHTDRSGERWRALRYR
ncbi:MAG: acyl-CoA dehydrogenase family protein [Acidimicrobiales bacterium]